ncbi:hypothetical protein [Desulfobacter postgatei]|uniref:hypothetical protein n=1 Tax=Desulfobacter postgatei TaxID=2293 RepID=UPI00259B109C|nr:hypothetical protein [uncultured Desulfobacter sp.]
MNNFLSVLDSQPTRFASEQGATTICLAWLSNLVNLYKVLGGRSEPLPGSIFARVQAVQ